MPSSNLGTFGELPVGQAFSLLADFQSAARRFRIVHGMAGQVFEKLSALTPDWSVGY